MEDWRKVSAVTETHVPPRSRLIKPQNQQVQSKLTCYNYDSCHKQHERPRQNKKPFPTTTNLFFVERILSCMVGGGVIQRPVHTQRRNANVLHLCLVIPFCLIPATSSPLFILHGSSSEFFWVNKARCRKCLLYTTYRYPGSREREREREREWPSRRKEGKSGSKCVCVCVCARAAIISNFHIHCRKRLSFKTLIIIDWSGSLQFAFKTACCDLALFSLPLFLFLFI